MRFLKALITLLFVCPFAIQAQNLAVTATITDSDSQTWNYGSFSVQLVSPNGSPTYNGTPVSTATQYGTLNSSGMLAVTLYNSSTITPYGSYYRWLICSNTSAPCASFNSSVTNANMSSVLSAQVSAPRLAAGVGAFAYSDVEITPIPVPGGFYFNTTTPIQRIWNGSSWINNGGGGGGGNFAFPCIIYGTAINAARCTLQADVTALIGSSTYDPYGAAASALTAAEAFSANGSNISSGTVANAYLPGAGSFTGNGQVCTLAGTCSFPFTCGGSGGFCPEQQLNPTSTGGVTTLSGNITATQTTIPLTSGTGFTFAPGNIVTIGGFEWAACSGFSAGNLTGCTRGFYTGTPGTGIATTTGTPVIQATQINAINSTTAPSYVVLANQAYSFGNTLNIGANSEQHGGLATFVGGIAVTNTVLLSGGTGTSTAIYTPQASTYNNYPGTCETSGILHAVRIGSYSWYTGAAGINCSIATNLIPPGAYVFVPGNTGTNPTTGFPPAAWLTPTGNFNDTGGYSIANVTVIPGTTTGYNGTTGTKIPLAVSYSTPTILTNICHDSNGNITDTSCPTSTGTNTPGANVAQVWGFGTSIVKGLGAQIQGVTNWMSMIQASTLAPVYNQGVSSTTLGADVMLEYLLFQPTFTTPSGLIFESGENDSAATGTSVYAVQNSYMAADAWVLIPPQYRIMSSLATKTGTWFYDSNFPIFTPSITTSLGTELISQVAASTLTFNIPTSASTKVGITYGVDPTLGASSFTVNIDGTNVTNNCTSTTTFTSGVCNGYGTRSMNRQEFTVTSGTTHTVIITNNNTIGAEIIGVDWLPPATSPNNGIVVHAGVSPSFSSYATLNPIAQTVVSTLQADNLNIVYSDTVNGNPGLNLATDFSSSQTTTCPATSNSGHPNDCGQVHYYQTIMNAMKSANLTFGFINQSGKDFRNSGGLSSYLSPLQIIPVQLGNAAAPAPPILTAGAAAGTSPSCSTIIGAPMAGVINCTTGTAPTTGTLATISFNGNLFAAPAGCSLTPRNAAAASAANSIYTTAPSAGGWSIGVGTALTLSTNYLWSYICM